VQHRNVVVQKYRWLVPVWNQKLVFDVARLLKVRNCLVDRFGVSRVEQLQVSQVAVELTVNDHVVDWFYNFVDFHHLVFGITNSSFFDQGHGHVAPHEILKVNRVLAKPEATMQMKKGLIKIIEEMINTSHVAMNSHHLDRVMPKPDKNTECLLESFECLFIGVPVEVDDAGEEGDLVVVIDLGDGHLVAEIEQSLEDGEGVA
jgi:hypothetical protein